MFIQFLKALIGFSECLAIGAPPAVPVVTVPAEPYLWRPVQIVGGGFISGIRFHPAEKGLAYCRTDIGGAYRWDVQAGRWIPLLDWLTAPDWNLYGIESIGLDPSDPRRLYLDCGTYTATWAQNGAILRSDDQGRTFKRTDLPFKNGGNEDGRSMGERLAVDPNDGRILFLGTRSNGLWKSQDCGATWSKALSFPVQTDAGRIGVTEVLFDSASGLKGHATPVLFAFEADNAGGIYESTNGGQSWAKVKGQPAGLFVHQALITGAEVLVATLSNGPGPNGISDGRVKAYNCRKQTWSDISPIKPSSDDKFGYAGLTLDPHHPGTMAVSTMDRWKYGDDIFVTLDGGHSWSALREKSRRDAAIAPYMKWGGKEPNFGWWIGALAMDPFNPRHVEYGTGANIWRSTNVTPGNQSQWSVGGLGIEETACIDLVSPGEGPHLISGLGDIGGFTHIDLDKSPDGGMMLYPQLDNTDSIDVAGLAQNMVVKVGRPNKKNPSGGFSRNAGLTWQPFATEPVGRGSGCVTISSDGKVILWVPEDGVAAITTDFGASWSPANGLPERARVAYDRVDPKLAYAVGAGKCFVSTDGGLNFSQTGFSTTSRPGTPKPTPGVEGDFWIPIDHGLYHSTDRGQTLIRLPSVDSADGFGFGMAAPNHQNPTLFLNGSVAGSPGVFRSIDGGTSWTRISDSRHEYGVRNVIIGDPRIFGRVYLGSNGRGLFYGDPARP